MLAAMQLHGSRVARFFSSIVVLLGLSASVAHADPLAPEAPLCKVPPAGAKIDVVFQPKVALRDLVVWFSSISCKKVIFASELGDQSAAVTVVGGGKMTGKEATELFRNALTALGINAAVKGDTWILTPNPKAVKCAPTVSQEEHAPIDPSIGRSLEETRLAAGITAVDETHFTIKRASFGKMLDEPMELAKGARAVPWMKDGKPAGFKLYAIRPSSLYAAMGFNNGDTLSAINGTQLTSADVALEKYAALSAAKHIELGIVRRGKSVTLVYDIVD